MTTFQLDLNKRYSYADYLTWLDDKRRELINGFIHLMTPAPSRKHQKISGQLFTEFNIYLRNNKKCEVYPAPFDVRLPISKDKTKDEQIYTVVQPDITVVCDPLKLDDRGCIGVPDLIVEIVSQSSSQKDLNDKFKVYEQAGVREYWIVNPNDENISVFVITENGKYQLKGMYAGNMKINVSIFKDLIINLRNIFID